MAEPQTTDPEPRPPTAFWLSAAALVAASLLAFSAFLLHRQAHGAPTALVAIAAAFFLVGAVIAPLVVTGLRRGREARRDQLEAECRELGSIADEIKDRALGRLVSFNFRLMDRFVDVAVVQAKASYIACSVAASAALLVLLLGTAVVMIADSLGMQIAAGALAAMGAGLASYLSSTFLRTFQLTSRQLSYYYGQPLVHCYLLHAEWLGERFEEDSDPENRWRIRHRLIEAALTASENAQNHLLDLQLSGERTSPAVRAGQALSGSWSDVATRSRKRVRISSGV